MLAACAGSSLRKHASGLPLCTAAATARSSYTYRPCVPGDSRLGAPSLSSALPADAQQPVTLQFNAGQVTLSAQNAPVRAILAEWARLGGATVVNGDRVAGPPVTLELTDVPERQALDVILRGVAGYMLAPRRAGSMGASAFDRIMILPTSVAPRNPPPAAAAARAWRSVVRA